MNKFEMGGFAPLKNTVERGELIEQKLSQLYDALNGYIIKNADSVDITLHVTREKMTGTSEELWYVTFEYEYRGKVIHRKYPQANDYIKIYIVPKTGTITVEMAQLETQILKGKNVYPQVIHVLSENFPSDFVLDAEFGHEVTKKSILEARNEYQQGKIDEEQCKQKILQSYLFKTRIASGFNSFELSFSVNNSDEVSIRVRSRKNKSSDQVELKVLGL